MSEEGNVTCLPSWGPIPSTCQCRAWCEATCSSKERPFPQLSLFDFILSAVQKVINTLKVLQRPSAISSEIRENDKFAFHFCQCTLDHVAVRCGRTHTYSQTKEEDSDTAPHSERLSRIPTPFLISRTQTHAAPFVAAVVWHPSCWNVPWPFSIQFLAWNIPPMKKILLQMFLFYILFGCSSLTLWSSIKTSHLPLAIFR